MNSEANCIAWVGGRWNEEEKCLRKSENDCKKNKY
jgi:hypothetical protein